MQPRFGRLLSIHGGRDCSRAMPASWQPQTEAHPVRNKHGTASGVSHGTYSVAAALRQLRHQVHTRRKVSHELHGSDAHLLRRRVAFQRAADSDHRLLGKLGSVGRSPANTKAHTHVSFAASTRTAGQASIPKRTLPRFSVLPDQHVAVLDNLGGKTKPRTPESTR